jgi:hypothetical protein
MPGPAIRGRCVREIIVPKKTVCKNDCERCKRTWYTDENTDTAKVIVKMVGSKGEAIVDASYDVICDGCVQTVGNLLKALARDMKKLGSSKPRAKKEGATAPSEPNGSTPKTAPVVRDDVVILPARTQLTGELRPPPSGPSKPR